MKHFMSLNPAPFYMIKSGEKTIELRLYDEKRRRINVSDEIEFLNTDDENEKILVRVLRLHRFKSFDELYGALPLLKCGYSKNDIAIASPEDMTVYYSREQQTKYGVLGIEIELI